MNSILTNINNVMYTFVLLILLAGVGIYFTIRTRGVQIRLLKDGIASLMEKSEKTDQEGQLKVSSFQALMISTASRVGTGNIAGIATAIAAGGTGSVFWMWLMAVIGGASAFVESTLDQETTDRLTAELVEMYREVYAHSKYTVDSASRMDENTYSVKVTVEPIDIFHLVADDLDNGAMDELNSRYPESFESEAQYAQYEVEWVERMIELVYENLPDLGYLDPTSTLVQVSWDEDENLWGIPDDDFWSLDALIIDYNF